ncbi:hypothetical protein PGB28_03455 [Primorskyibacter aestuariivivens]|uniref:hypothetical protein n=1 Tax=Primorskyibacter aestuariivivens TaxID=1888912 RepID=UPI0023015FE8|nr:hypothetical protein [Primorskyibacter aestuariivivens]MDA7427502.1 hypothetical protein [Primorskyibacter aestuariivivens]
MALVEYPPFRPENLFRTLEAKVPQKFLRDIKNRVLFGPDAPLSDEPLYVRPRDITLRYVTASSTGAPLFRRRHSGLVKGGDWDLSVEPMRHGPKYRACHARWIEGKNWEETGIYDLHLDRIARKGVSDECRTLEDIKARYERLDHLFEQVRREGRLRAISQIDSYFRREHGGVFVHIDRHGRPLRYGGGEHRFAIAHILNLPEMPVQPGVIHLEAVRGRHLERLRRSVHG